MVLLVLMSCISGSAAAQSTEIILLPHQQSDTKVLQNGRKPFRDRLFTSFTESAEIEVVDSVQRRSALPSVSGIWNTRDETGQSNVVGEIQAQWIRQYASNLFPSDDYANAVCTDPSKDICVTGVSFTTFSDADYLTVKYSTRGDTIWTKRFNGRGNGYDEAVAVGADSAGNIYVTGYSDEGGNNVAVVTLKYDPQGNLIWENRLPDSYDSAEVPTAMAVNPDGTVYVTGYAYREGHSYDIFLVRYSGSGETDWLQYYDGVTSDVDVPTSISVREGSFLIIGGFSLRSGSGYDAIIVWFSEDGSLLWLDRYTGDGNADDYFSTVTLCENGKAIAAGASYRSSSHYDMLIIQYSASGDRDWLVLRDGSFLMDDRIVSVQADDSGNIFVTGYITTMYQKENILTLRYDSSGTVRWSSVYDGPKSFSDAAVGMAVDQIYNKIYVTGYSANAATEDRDLITLKYDYEGTILWIARYVSPTGGDDAASAIALDANGDLVVSGSSHDVGSTNDFVTIRYLNFESDHWPAWFSNGNGRNSLKTIRTDKSGYVYIAGTDTAQIITGKYDSVGSRIWLRSLGNGQSTVGSMLVNKDGDIYVAGSTRGENGKRDAVIVKYDGDGGELWSAVYRGNSAGNNYFADIAIDSAGYIYVTGTSYGEFTSADYITIKYDPDGTEVWNARFNGRLNYRDSAVAIAVTSSGNVYVTGTGIRSNSSYDYLTLKYTSDGQLAWSAYYNGPGNGGDFARAIDLDTSGNVYVTGRSYGFFTLTDYATVKYTADGEMVWVARFDGFGNSFDDPSDLVIDKEGNIYVTGIVASASTGYDIMTVKYNANGLQLWKARYNGPGNADDNPTSLSTDPEGFVYLGGSSVGDGTGRDILTIKYNPQTGAQMWTFRYDYLASNDDIGTAMVLDAFNSVYVGGNSIDATAQQGIVMLKYTTSGITDQLWTARLKGPGMSFDQGRSIITDESGNIIIGGTSVDPSSGEDFALIKYLSDGTLSESMRYNGPFFYDDDLQSIVRDSKGNIYLAGTIYKRFYPCDYGIVKYSSQGTKEWERFYNGESDSYDFVTAAAVDDSDNVILTGFSAGEQSYDYVTIKYSPSGDEQWIETYDAAGGGDDLAYAATTDKEGNILIAGLSYGGGSNSDYSIVKYSREGTLLWSQRYNGDGGFDDRIVDIAVDNSNNIYVTGWSVGSDTTYDIVTIKYDSQGETKWIRKYPGQQRSNQFAVSMILNGKNHVIVTGRQLEGTSNYADVVTLSYDTSGNLLWAQTYDGPGGGDDAPAALAVDSESAVYVTGKTRGLDDSYDFLTIKYDTSGEVRWLAHYSALHGSDDEAADIAVDGEGNVIVTGTSRGRNWRIISTVKYSSIETGVIDELQSIPDRLALDQNFPNPFNPETIIRYHIPAIRHLPQQWVTLKVYNVIGQEVETIVDKTETAGEHEVIFRPDDLPSGLYIYRLMTSGGYSLARKMLLLR